MRDLKNDLHQRIHNFKSHAPMQRFVWSITDPVVQLLKPSVNYRYGLSGNVGWISEGAENGLHKRS